MRSPARSEQAGWGWCIARAIHSCAAIAVKVLPELFAADAERLARFEREAHTLASLNHPSIAQIYRVERSRGTLALVMELVEGADLSTRIARGRLDLPTTLHVARQIADALEAAHERGIVHRDLKPANVQVRDDGIVKVLDFGLAKLADQDFTPGVDPQNSPTFTSPARTQIGAILGTAAYMAPEQAKGKAVDKRADIWAFGCVLFEMLAGRAPFAGETISDVVASILTAEPDWTRLPVETAGSVRRLLRRCLEKDPKRRLRDIADARLELEAAADRSDPDSRVMTEGLRIPWAAAAALVVVAAGLGAGLALSFQRRRPEGERQAVCGASRWLQRVCTHRDLARRRLYRIRSRARARTVRALCPEHGLARAEARRHERRHGARAVLFSRQPLAGVLQ